MNRDERMGPDADGKMAKITPRVWAQARGAPVSSSIQPACGRVSYTTYHTQPTAEVYDPRQPQALALLYWILEVGVCMDPVVIGYRRVGMDRPGTAAPPPRVPRWARRLGACFRR